MTPSTVGMRVPSRVLSTGKKRRRRSSFQVWRLCRHLVAKVSRPLSSTWNRRLLKLCLPQCRYISLGLVSSVIILQPLILLIVSLQPSESDLRRLIEVEEGRLVTVTWRGLETPPRRESLGCLEEDPAEGPPSHFTVEERFRGFRLGVGFSRHDVDEVMV